MGFLHSFLIPTFERVPVEHGLRAGLALAILPICLSRPCFYHTQLPLCSTVLVLLLQVLSMSGFAQVRAPLLTSFRERDSDQYILRYACPSQVFLQSSTLGYTQTP